MIPICVYSNSDYNDVLQIQAEYISAIKSNKYLLTNNAHNDHSFSVFDEVIRYDDSKPYATRLHSLKNLKHKYVLFMHDMDILIHKDDSILLNLVDHMEKNNIDRIDLKHHSVSPSESIIKLDDKINLVLQKDVNQYIYNVNPSIWKIESLLKIMELFSYCSYRAIENLQVQTYAKNQQIYKLTGSNKVRCGYFICMEYFQYLHITHHGQFLPNTNNLLDEFPSKEYEKIYSKYIINSNRRIKASMW